jgi:disulfide bond formation protein DsbB
VYTVSGSDGRPRTWYLVAVAWVVACVATAGSLFYSNVWNLYPCDFCWFQRILMYPLVVVLGVGLFYPGEDHAVGRFVLPFSLAGVAVAGYHSLLQLESSGLSCSVGGCGVVNFRAFGVLSIPNQALVAFVLISLAVGAASIHRSGSHP